MLIVHGGITGLGCQEASLLGPRLLLRDQHPAFWQERDRPEQAFALSQFFQGVTVPGCFDHVASPPFAINVTGAETLSIRRTAEQFAERMGKGWEYLNEVMRLVLDAYVEPVNVERAMAGARLGMTDALDGDSAYLDAEQFAEYGRSAPEEDADIGLTLTSPMCPMGPEIMAATTRAAMTAGSSPRDVDSRSTWSFQGVSS